MRLVELTLNHALDGVERSGIRKFTALAAQTPGCCRLTLGEPDLNTAEPVKAAARLALERNETHYCENNGTRSVREAVSRFEEARNGLHYSPDEIIMTAGATEAIFISLFSILNPGDEVIIPTPAFSLYESVVRLCRGVPVLLSTADDHFQLTEQRLRGAITSRTKALILTSPNNPTGCVYTRETLEGIHRVVRDLPVFILCDEVYRQLVYTGDFQSFSSYEDLRDRILVAQSFSKPYAMTGWRAGYLMCDAPLHDRIQVVHQYDVVSIPTFVQPACEEALRYDNSADVALFRRRRDYVYAALTEMGLAVEKPEGAFYAFADIRRFGMDSLTFCTRMLKEGLVAAVPGCYFGGEGFMRISYCYSDEALKEGLDRVARFIRTLE